MRTKSVRSDGLSGFFSRTECCFTYIVCCAELSAVNFNPNTVTEYTHSKQLTVLKGFNILKRYYRVLNKLTELVYEIFLPI